MVTTLVHNNTIALLEIGVEYHPDWHGLHAHVGPNETS
jgi:hypothetical protein